MPMSGRAQSPGKGRRPADSHAIERDVRLRMEYQDREGLFLPDVRDPAFSPTQEWPGHLDRECALSRGSGSRFDPHQARFREPANPRSRRGGQMTRVSRLIFALLASLIVGNAAAQTSYPEKPIRMVVGFPPGGAPDTVARLLGQRLSEALRQPVVTDNATGAGGNIATERVAKAAPDGYTLGFLVNGQLVINPSMYKLAFDPAKDLAPISQVTVTPNMLVVNTAVPAKNLQELISLARAKPGELTFASGGA